MAYFSEFPTIEYDIDKDGKTVILTNILRGVQFNSVLKENILLHDRYAFEDRDRPEHIAYKTYKDSELHWLILSLNGAIDPNYDVPVSETGLFAYTNEKYPGQTYFVGDAVGASPFGNISGSFTNGEYVYAPWTSWGGTIGGASFDTNSPRVKLVDGSSTDDVYNGGVLFVHDGANEQYRIITDYDGSTKWATLDSPLTPKPDTDLQCGDDWAVLPSGKVNRWDATYSRLEVTGVYGTISEDDLLTGVTSGTVGYVRRKVSFSRDAVHHFENVDTGKWYDPYDSDTQYLAGYAVPSGSPNSTIEATVITNQQYEKDLNDGKRFISLLQTDAIGQARADFERIMDEE
jgi:hypothetical protein